MTATTPNPSPDEIAERHDNHHQVKKYGSPREPYFAKATTAKYRKVGDNAARITEYAEA